jgi:hypothetical protein
MPTVAKIATATNVQIMIDPTNRTAPVLSVGRAWRVQQGAPDIHHERRADVELASGRTNSATADERVLYGVVDARRDWRASNPLTGRDRLRLPGADGMGELGAAVFVNDVEHHRGGAPGIQMEQVQHHAAIPKALPVARRRFPAARMAINATLRR